MFDRDDPIEIKMWHKLAMNLLYALPSKNIVKNYGENRASMPSAAEPVTPVPARSGAGSIRSRQSNNKSTFNAKSSMDNHNSHGSINNGNNSPDSQQKSEMKRATSRKSRSIVSVFMKDKKPDVRSIL